jgi:hypothetical protein
MTLFTKAPFLHQSDSVQILPSYFFKVDFNIVLSYMVVMWSLSFRFPHQNPVCISVMLLEPVKSATLAGPKPEWQWQWYIYAHANIVMFVVSLSH